MRDLTRLGVAVFLVVFAPFAQSEAGTFTPLYTFQGGTDGAFPTGIPQVYNGLLYGTTMQGGNTQCSRAGCGTLYSVDPSTGAETVLHRFLDDAADKSLGQNPTGSLSFANGLLYGSVETGGRKPGARGALFTFDPNAGLETIQHSFAETDIGTHGLVQNGFYAKDDLLYGASTIGPKNAGFIFTWNTTSNAVSIIYQFSMDNQLNSPVLVSGNLLYGTTQTSIFRLKLSTSALRKMYTFTNIADGYAPKGNLVLLQQKLYGVNYAGGQQQCAQHDDYACGTLFSYDVTARKFSVVHYFSGPDGAQPGAGLTAMNGILYGTTTTGGDNNTGTIFSFDPSSGQETVLYSLPSDSTEQSVSGLSASDGTLYGTYGTALGHATIFKYVP